MCVHANVAQNSKKLSDSPAISILPDQRGIYTLSAPIGFLAYIWTEGQMWLTRNIILSYLIIIIIIIIIIIWHLILMFFIMLNDR